MTLLWADGFEGRDVWLAGKYNGSVGTAWGYGVATRYGSGLAVNGTESGAYFQKTFTASAEIYASMAVWSNGTGANWVISFFGDAGATQHLSITQSAGGVLELRRGNQAGTILGSTAAIVMPASTWVFFEVHLTVADSGGIAEMRINGATTNAISFTGDTKNAGTATTLDMFRIMSLSNGTSIAIDDLVICNGLGTRNNTWTGDIRCQTLVPTGAGSSTGLTASTGANWTTVDEAPPVSTDYSGSPTSGARDTYAMADLSVNTATVLGVVGVSWMHKSDTGAASMKPAIKSSSTVAYGVTQSLATTMTGYSDLFETDPATSASWTVSGVNAVEYGAEVV